MSANPKISVIMSVFNGMPYLKEAVKSILCQSYKNFEFIIVDDASSDMSWRYLKSIKDDRVILLKNKKNLGLSLSLNKAIKQSKGAYIARMDADDISYSQRLDIQLNFLKQHKNIDLCGSWVTLINNSGNIIGVNKKNPLDNERIKKKLGIYPTIIHPTFFAKRKFFINSGGYKDEFDGAEEYELLCRVKNKFSYANIPEKTLYWRLRDNRRSIQIMDKMHDLDMKIKINNLKKDGPNFYNIYGYLKIITLHYLIPLAIKKKIARFLKTA